MFSSNTSQVSADANWIEECFSTHLYQGNGSTQTITNGIDLSTNGGLVWIKPRTDAASGENGHSFYDTLRGVKKVLRSNSTAAQNTLANDGLTAFSTTGFSVSDDTFGSYGVNGPNARTFVSWTFREQAKFFDVVTYTGNGTARTISHSLGSVPGCIIVKRTDSGESWYVYHRSIGAGGRGILNSTDAFSTSGATNWNNTEPTSTQFSLGASSTVNASGGTYVAYLFAHDAGGFGLTGTDNVISCGSFTTDGSGYIPAVTLGYEPQLLLFKASSTTGNWAIWDTMRGFSQASDLNLSPNTSAAESDFGSVIEPTATGFQNGDGAGFNPSVTYIYIAIRRGPMKTPTTGTSVFAPYVTSSLNNLYNAGFVTDWVLQRYAANTDGWYTGPRLTGGSTGGYYMKTESTAAEVFSSAGRWDSNTGAWNFNANYGLYAFQRAPGFFDVVCYTGTGSATTFNHNLGVVPEMMIVKRRSSSGSDWWVYNAPRGATKSLRFTDEAEFTLLNIWNNTAPTSSVFTVGADSAVNGGSSTYVWYGFASCPGVSKVGSYTGTGTTLQIDCGFTGGARFVLIKRTDSTGDWYVWDSARGIVSGNDPYLLLNSTAAEVTNTDYVDTYSAGFEISSTAPAAINANGGSFIFLAIA